MATRMAMGNSGDYWRTRLGEDFIEAEYTVVDDRKLESPQEALSAPEEPEDTPNVTTP